MPSKMHQQDLDNSKTYSTAYLSADRAPNPLSIFNVGLDKRLGNRIGIYHGFMPTLWDARMHGTDNPFIAFFSSIDIVFVFEVILSLMGLIFAYDAIAGERERTRHVTPRSRTAYWTRADFACKIYQCDGMSVGSADIESTFCLLLLTRSIPLSTADFLRIVWYCSDIVRVSVAILSHWIADFRSERVGLVRH